MKVMVVGGGGREHAIIKALKKNPEINGIYCLPGNGGIAADATCVDISSTDIERIRNFTIDNGIDYAVVAQDDPLALGLVDEMTAVGIPCFGPDKKAAMIEASKVFSKNLMKKYGIPTADYEVFTDIDAAYQYLDSCQTPIVVKADGLALGKGVIVAQTIAEAKQAVLSMIQEGKFGKSGQSVVIEEYLTGPEVTVLAFTDGNALVPMVSSMDYKRAHDDDEGLNTGGMGVIAPNPYYTHEIAAECMEKIFLPTVHAMNAEGRTFKGCLYFGLMITPNGPKVIEYNCRFGDPEAQAVLALMKTDLFTVMQAVSNGKLSDIDIQFSKEAACCVIMASKGYPEKYEKGFEISIPENLKSEIYIAGARRSPEGKLLTNGGRVLGVTAKASTLKAAISMAYADVNRIHFHNEYFRQDIGKRALKA